MNVLITSASRKVSLVRSFQQALQCEGGGLVMAVDCSPLSPALYRANLQAVVPRQSAPEFLPYLLNLCRENSIALLIPTRDEELPFFSDHMDHFMQSGIRTMVAPPEVIATCQDKIGFVNFCQGHGFSVPLTYTLEEVRTKNPYPVFVRPRVGKGSRGAAIARHGADLDRMATDHQDLLIQEYIEAPEYTIDLFADFDGQVISAVPRERVSVFGGESFITTTRKDDRLIAEAVRLAECLGLVGHNTIQCFKRDGGRVTFIEVNPRFGGAAHLGFQAGAPSPRFLIKLMNGQKLDPCLGLFQDNLTMLRYSEDLFLSGDDLIKMRDPA